MLSQQIIFILLLVLEKSYAIIEVVSLFDLEAKFIRYRERMPFR